MTLNHELNTAMEAIGLQLELMKRRTHDSQNLESCLENIRRSLGRMAETVDSLKHIQRIVVTDYLAGIKMLDLRCSTQGSSAEPEAPSGSE